MKPLYQSSFFPALIHYPVKNRRGDTIASAITNLDLHDIARAARTYGIDAFYVVTPLSDQQQLAEKIADHWRNGIGGRLNPDRREALDLIRVKDSLYDVETEIRERTGCPVKVVVTSAGESSRQIGHQDFRRMLRKNGEAYLLALGTAWGLTESFIENADYVLAPIKGADGYNHLSVRSAAAIMFDRILGNL